MFPVHSAAWSPRHFDDERNSGTERMKGDRGQRCPVTQGQVGGRTGYEDTLTGGPSWTRHSTEPSALELPKDPKQMSELGLEARNKKQLGKS